MTGFDFIARAKARLAKRKPQVDRQDIAAALERIDQERGFITLAQQAREFQAQPFYAIFEERLNLRASALHEDLLNGVVSQEAYAHAYRLLKDVLLLAPSAVERGREAGEQLEAWRSDGTLEEAELWRGRAKE